MSGSIELDRDGRSLVIRFPYSEFLVEEVRGLPGRRWDKANRVWKVPAEHAEAAVEAFMKHHFAIAADVYAVMAGTQSTPAAEAPTAGASAGAAIPPDGGAGTGALSVGQLNARVRAAIKSAFPERVSVVGEVVNYDKNRGRAHLFFSLVEKEDTAGGNVRAHVDVAMFSRTAARLVPALEAKGLTLCDGIEILIEATVDLYEATGRYQLIVEDIRPEFTLGKLALSRAEILDGLRAAGLASRNRELPVPVPALRIAVLSSPESDGWNDFIREIEASGIGFDVTIVPVKVQGEALRPTMLRGLKYFAERADQFDILCILRGGGSRTDLAWFDDREVAFAVAQHPLKVLCGIGHERDTSVLDEIALSVKTPTAAAGWLIDAWHENHGQLLDRSARLREAALALLHAARLDLTRSGHDLRSVVTRRLDAERTRLATCAVHVRRGAENLVRARDRQLHEASRRVVLGVRNFTSARRAGLDRIAERIGEAAERRLERAHATLATAETRQRLLDPARVLKRGFALLRGADGRIVTDANQVESGDLTTVQLRDGRLHARISTVELDTEPGS
ncbi:MAG: exodeoxyribonuclease large subunit [Planctomycetota bacterium]